MLTDPDANEYWTQFEIVTPLKKIANRSGLEYGDLLAITAGRLLLKLRNRVCELASLEDPVAYTIKIAQRVARELDPTTLERRRRTRAERSRWSSRNTPQSQPHGGTDTSPYHDLMYSDMINKILEVMPEDMRPIIDFWMADPFVSPTASVAELLGISRPTARKRIKTLRALLSRSLQDYSLS